MRRSDLFSIPMREDREFPGELCWRETNRSRGYHQNYRWIGQRTLSHSQAPGTFFGMSYDRAIPHREKNVAEYSEFLDF